MTLQEQIKDAMWAGDVDKLDKLARCRCCCWEHTYGRGCPAYQWGGCRGQGTDEGDEEAWARHYARFHGMTREQFFDFAPLTDDPNVTTLNRERS